MTQLALFENPTLPAHNGTATSREAAESIVPHVNGQQQQILAELRQLGQHGATREELQIATGLDGNALRPRCLELRAKGLIVESSETRLTKSGRRAFVLKATGSET